ncbi:FAD-dependent oxidoreductase [Bordetella petrii]|uniref:FAD-binding protein n=1 Tax=Bordetella petrii TaxID=94624 RepID=A0ABT7W720_9BORD|nr:FAD-dependent oxidoreductase [Bordetella petrii]MDM9560984.1 FAD-binding protein [Bordetella petrii]
MDTPRWNSEVDAIVVGSGAAGMTAALTAHTEGLQVLLVEKTGRIGGSTAISGGALWLPLNDQSAAAGHPDTYEQVWAYLEQTVGDAAPAALKRAYLEAAPRVLRYLAGHGLLEAVARRASPDYYPDRPGAALGGRSLDPAEFDGRRLGRRRFRELRDPLPEFLVLGGMMVSVADVRHLLNATRKFESWRHAMKLVLRYGADRLRGYHRGTRLLLGNALAGQLFHALLQRQVPYWLDTPAVALHRDADGRATGLTVRRAGRPWHVRARRGIVLATGGFPWDRARRAQAYPQPTGAWSMAPQGNTGDGIRLALEAGATLGPRPASPAFWAPVSILARPDGSQVRYPHLVWDRAKPGLIAVNGAGRRFVNESASYHEFVLAMYRSHRETPSIPAFLICDRQFIDTWGLGLALPGGRPRRHLIESGYLHEAATLAELAARLKLPADALQDTVARYNAHASQGIDPDFGKGGTAYNRYLGDPDHRPNPCLAPLGAGPYYAVQVVAGDIGTAWGLATDEHARILDRHGAPIDGLYAAGNDMHSVMGGAYPGPGITLGPALTFGWLAARHLAGASPATLPEETA